MKYYRALLIALVFLAVQVMVSLLGVACLGFMGRSITDLPFPFPALVSVISAFLIICVAMVMRMIDREHTFSVRALSVAGTSCIFCSSMLVMVGMNVFMEFLNLPDYNATQMEQILRHPLGIFSVVCVAPLVEELVFREAMISEMKRGGVKGVWAIVIAALVFGIVHLNPSQVPYAFVMGALLGFLYLSTGSIVLPFMIHVANNGLAVLLLFWLGPEASFTQLLGGEYTAMGLALLACLLGIVGVFYGVRKMISSRANII